ncbi:iron-containing alcohol dehydrogenase [Haploplasma axanthum]|uniref:Alcohol dehydrogenase 2 n=1 Tax=Haploplasma axanthum TaxID=29552 RepID=A0A449BDZ8_HAPAX|nr:iron-containing alcohol dehydrogenase [Haploplasma axanthum]VEU80655.1 Alcohol dehydrogenase 2 [Haploplasma axanthum]
MKIISRIYQKILKIGSYFLDFSEPIVINYEDSINDCLEIIKNEKVSNIFIVTDKNIIKLGLINSLLELLGKEKNKYNIYDEVSPNPTVKQVEVAYYQYLNTNSEVVIVVGGGSPMDLAKAILVRKAKPKKTLDQFKGILKVRKKLDCLIAIPTTVGTGSEATIAAVVTNEETKEKYAIMDPCLIPKYAILDPNLLRKLPKSIISTTGMDTLTHAIEAFIGNSNTRKTKEYSKEAIKIVFNDLEKAYNGDFSSLKEMQYASYKAGVAFTRAYVGNVHALSHALSAYYHLPHGYTNAVILPHILKYYGKKVDKKLSVIYDYLYEDRNLSKSEKAKFIIDKIENMNKNMDIPRGFKGIIKDEDIDSIINHAYHEANPLYPVPVIFSKNDFRKIITEINK